MNCLSIRTLATEYLEGALGEKDRREFELHLKSCEKCQNWMESFEGTIEMLGKLRKNSQGNGGR